MDNYQSVFDAYPKLDKIYVVDGMPFTTEREAQNHARRINKEVETVERDSEAKSAKGKPAKTEAAGSRSSASPSKVAKKAAGDVPPAE